MGRGPGPGSRRPRAEARAGPRRARGGADRPARAGRRAQGEGFVGNGPVGPDRRCQRRTEAYIELHRPGVPRHLAAGGEEGAAHLAGDGRFGGRETEIAGEVGRQVDDGAQDAVEQTRLLSGLVGPGADELMGPVGGDDDERDAGGIGLQNGRVQVGDGRPGRGENSGQASASPVVQGTVGAQRHETGAALVHGDARQELPALLSGRDDGDEGGRAGAGGEDIAVDADTVEGVDDGAGHPDRGRLLHGRAARAH